MHNALVYHLQKIACVTSIKIYIHIYKDKITLLVLQGCGFIAILRTIKFHDCRKYLVYSVLLKRKYHNLTNYVSFLVCADVKIWKKMLPVERERHSGKRDINKKKKLTLNYTRNTDRERAARTASRPSKTRTLLSLRDDNLVMHYRMPNVDFSRNAHGQMTSLYWPLNASSSVPLFAFRTARNMRRAPRLHKIKFQHIE